uniref:Uncharacterized protein n=1 Tax=Anguilla anguilla TaxID=7936 RepID=A0A0E9XF09_ANGAN
MCEMNRAVFVQIVIGEPPFQMLGYFFVCVFQIKARLNGFRFLFC